jgi:hypothetical protein
MHCPCFPSPQWEGSRAAEWIISNIVVVQRRKCPPLVFLDLPLSVKEIIINVGSNLHPIMPAYSMGPCGQITAIKPIVRCRIMNHCQLSALNMAISDKQGCCIDDEEQLRQSVLEPGQSFEGWLLEYWQGTWGWEMIDRAGNYFRVGLRFHFLRRICRVLTLSR